MTHQKITLSFFRPLLFISALGLGSVAMAGCPETEGTMENAGEEMDEAAGEVEEAVE